MIHCFLIARQAKHIVLYLSPDPPIVEGRRLHNLPVNQKSLFGHGFKFLKWPARVNIPGHLEQKGTGSK